MPDPFMDTARIAVLLEPFLKQPLVDSQLEQISMYIDLLQRWNARINLTAIRNEEEIVTRHFGESLFLARHVFQSALIRDHLEGDQGGREASPSAESKDPYQNSDLFPRVLDIGSGAGFPALPMKIWDPAIRLTLVESNHKKATFLREVARALTFTNVDVISERAETLIEGRERRADVVTLRAVERFDTVLPVAASLVTPGGVLALLIGSSQVAALKNIPSFRWNTPIPVPSSDSKVLAIGEKLIEVG
jgi:16S rRNA (guanine527-N7)-methyltransferase